MTVDPHAVERVMMNLIENACKYASPSADDEPDASEEFDTRVHLDVRVHDEMLELLIADHGPGIAPGERARIFGEFQRGSRGGRADHHGRLPHTFRGSARHQAYSPLSAARLAGSRGP